MDIFESLENLNVSEECFDFIINMVEEIINELKDEDAFKVNQQRQKNLRKAEELEDYMKKYSLSKEKQYKAEDDKVDKLIKRNRSDKIYNAWKKKKAEGKIKPAKKDEEKDE